MKKLLASIMKEIQNYTTMTNTAWEMQLMGGGFV